MKRPVQQHLFLFYVGFFLHAVPVWWIIVKLQVPFDLHNCMATTDLSRPHVNSTCYNKKKRERAGCAVTLNCASEKLEKKWDPHHLLIFIHPVDSDIRHRTRIQRVNFLIALEPKHKHQCGNIQNVGGFSCWAPGRSRTGEEHRQLSWAEANSPRGKKTRGVFNHGGVFSESETSPGFSRCCPHYKFVSLQQQQLLGFHSPQNCRHPCGTSCVITLDLETVTRRRFSLISMNHHKWRRRCSGKSFGLWLWYEESEKSSKAFQSYSTTRTTWTH